MTAITLALATLISEDLACVGAGLLVAQGYMGPASAIFGCYLGILLGDLGLFALGRWGGHALLNRPFWNRRIDQGVGRIGPVAVLMARFLPGARVPVYLGAGVLGMTPPAFFFWTAVACALWTPLLVGTVALTGDVLAQPLMRFFGYGWTAFLGAGALLVFALHVLPGAMTAAGRAKLFAGISRIWRWEFWPAWLFYLPLTPWIVFLSLRRGGLTTITAANPAIPHGGIVGESKFAILQALASEWIVSTELIPQGSAEGRIERLSNLVTGRNWQFPLVLKPDVGERGAGFRLAKSFDEAAAYLRSTTPAVLVQSYHPGPFEAGVFYYRVPGQPRGHIFSVTDKVFPVVTGDGRSTVEELIWRHPRYRMQAGRFLARLNGTSNRIPGRGETIPLATAGNHCQGTEFRDGARLITPELEERIDSIARSFEGFFFGRFDIRYRDPLQFRAGREFQIVELNGASSESTNLYDPRRSLLTAYRILFRQWELLFRIGHKNRALGHLATSHRELFGLIYSHLRRTGVNRLAD